MQSGPRRHAKSEKLKKIRNQRIGHPGLDPEYFNFKGIWMPGQVRHLFTMMSKNTHKPKKQRQPVLMTDWSVAFEWLDSKVD
jgi:hypothetical protein